MDVEREDEGSVAERDRRETRDAQAGFELPVDRGVLQVGEDDPLVESPVDRPVRRRDGEAFRHLPRAPETPLEDVIVVVPDVKAAADDPELGAKVPDDGFTHGGDGGNDIVPSLDGGEGLLDVLEE